MKNTQTFPLVMLPSEKANYSQDYKLQSGENVSVVILNTLILNKDNNKLVLNKNECWAAGNDTDILIPQHLYILSDEEIKEGDYFYSIRLLIEKAIINYSSKEHFGKIIATTDKSLNLPLIHGSFLPPFIKVYNEGKQITEVDLKMNRITVFPGTNSNKKETYQELELKTRPDNTVIVLESKKYSRDEVVKLFERLGEDLEKKYKSIENPSTAINKWIQENL